MNKVTTKFLISGFAHINNDNSNNPSLFHQVSHSIFKLLTADDRGISGGGTKFSRGTILFCSKHLKV